MKERIFIHFLNRELYRGVGIRKLKNSNYIFKVIFLCTDKIMIIPLSSIWESIHATDLDLDFLYSMYESRQVEVCSDCVTVEEFLYRNRSMYEFDKSRYNNIYFKVYKRLLNIYPTMLKPISATEGLSSMIDSWDETSIQLPIKDKLTINKNKLIIQRINYERENRALTISLFNNKLMSKQDNYSVARFLSAAYISNYCRWLSADIITGIGSGIEFFDFLSEDYPYNDLAFLQFILYTAGVRKEFFYSRNIRFWNKILECRALFSLSDISKLISNIISCSIMHVSFVSVVEKCCVRQLCQYISSKCHQLNIKEIKERSPYALLESLLENICMIHRAICYDSENTNALTDRDFLELNKAGFFQNGNIIQTLKDQKGSCNMKIFIVHGHDSLAKYELKNYIQNILQLGEPIILSEKPSAGLTIIEKFEKYALDSNLVFVLLTPDDEYGTEVRARQNVIFELGYFLGRLGREKGRVILLYKGRLDIPSDIAGLTYIDINGGVESAGEQIRREINIL